MNQLLARTALGAACADLALKLIPLGENGALLPGILNLTRLRNSGVAFGLRFLSPALTLAVTALLVLLMAGLLRGAAVSRLESVGAGLMLGGAFGNLMDRLLHGAVLDYLEPAFVNFPAFNLADACLTIGALLLALALLLPERKGTHG